MHHIHQPRLEAVSIFILVYFQAGLSLDAGNAPGRLLQEPEGVCQILLQEYLVLHHIGSKHQSMQSVSWFHVCYLPDQADWTAIKPDQFIILLDVKGNESDRVMLVA